MSLLSVIALAVLGSCSSQPRDHRDLTYDEFRSLQPASTFDPKGARHIYYSSTTGRNFSDMIKKLEIEKDDYHALIDVFSDKMDNLAQSPYGGRPIGLVRKRTTQSSTYPEQWPAVGRGDVPPWWQPPARVSESFAES